MDKKRSLASPVGASSLMVIFAVLCLTVFAVLSLATARSGYRQAVSAAESVREYYEADCLAEEILALIRNGQTPQSVIENNGIYYYTCPISETQTIEVSVKAENGEYAVVRWQSVPADEWSAGEDMDVWDGQTQQQKE